MTGDDILIVTFTHPPEGADEMARAIVERRLAACVQVVPGLRSHYRWEGALESADEVRLDAKTTAHRLERLVAFIREGHPYDVPEIIAMAAADVEPAYAAWVRKETAGEG